ncbi:unnamed protein product, partial [Brenthis ino]
MSKQALGNTLQNVRVDVITPQKQTYGEYLGYPQKANNSGAQYSTKSDFVYVNSAFVGSVNNVNSNRSYEPPTTVIREQYWACSKWSFAQRILALAVGILTGAVIGLAFLVVFRGDKTNLSEVF